MSIQEAADTWLSNEQHHSVAVVINAINAPDYTKTVDTVDL